MDKFFDHVGAWWAKFCGYFISVGNDWNEGRKPRAIGKIVILLGLIAILVFILCFIWAKREIIVGGFCLLLLIYSFAVVSKSTAPQKPTKPVNTDIRAEQLAKQGLTSLLEIIFAVLRSVAEYTPIVKPGSLGELPCPNRSTCIRVKDGVAIVSVMVHYTDPEINADQFMEHFNQRMAQMLDGHELPNMPNAVIHDADNNPHTSIQAISCMDCGDYLKLEVIRVNQEAVALLDAIANAKTAEDNNTQPPPVSPHF